MTMFKTTAYLQVTPMVRSGKARAMRVERVTQNHPHANALPGAAIIKLELALPASVFESLLTASVEVRAEDIEVVPLVTVIPVPEADGG